MTAPDGHPAEDYLRPKLAALIDDAVQDGIARDVVVAVLFELLDGHDGEDAGTR